MKAMWLRWARRERLIGLANLTLTAIALAVAVLIYLTGGGWFTAIPAAAALLVLVIALNALTVAHRYAKRAR